MTEETQLQLVPPGKTETSPPIPDRRADVESRQEQIAGLLRDVGCDGLMILRPENFAWLTAGGAMRGILDPDQLPALYYSPEARWLVASNADTQRVFDEEIDGLGFQLKEWPWHWGRTGLLADLRQGRKVACDTALDDCTVVEDRLRVLRRTMTEYDKVCYRSLGQLISHAIEATGRTLALGDSEREVAGQLSHRLLHRGAQPLLISVAADGRSRGYRQPAFTSAQVQSYCVLTVYARKYGVCAAASRSVCLGSADPLFRREHEAACKVSATYVASSWPDSVPRQILTSGQRVYQLAGAEHDFFMAPQGQLIGRAAVEQTLTLQDEDLLQPNWAILWRASVGAALSCDTFLIADDGPHAITGPENWPQKRIRIQGAEFVRPDLLVR